MPIKKIVDLAKEKNIPVLVDGTQGAPHLEINMQKLGCDFYAISCHKMYGPNGLGILYAKKKWLDELPPYQGGGGMISEVKKEKLLLLKHQLNLKLVLCKQQKLLPFLNELNLSKNLGIKNIENHENEIMEYGIEKLKKNNSGKYYWRSKRQRFSDMFYHERYTPS